MNVFTHLWNGRSDLPKTAKGFAYGWEHVRILARRIRNVIGAADFVQIYVYTDLHEPGVTEKDKNVQVTAIPMPANFLIMTDATVGFCLSKTL